jgi:ParB/RepB/Spo0J family partition protein
MTSVKEQRAAALAAAVAEPVEVHRNVLRDLTRIGQEEVPLHLIEPNPDQPREMVDESSLEFLELVGTIREHGLLQPISLMLLDSPTTEGKQYRIIAGERRFRAFSLLSREDPQEYGRIPATVVRVVGENKDAQVLMKALIENLVRADLKEGERANAIVRLKEATGWTWEQVGIRMGMDPNRVQALSVIARYPAVSAAIDDGSVSQGQGIAIGQASRDGEIAAAMIGLVGKASPESPLRKDGVVRKVAKTAREIDPTLPASERVARAAVLVGVEPSPNAVEEWDYVANGKREKMQRPIVVLANTALRTIRPRTSTMDRATFAEMIRQTCEQTNVWVVPTAEQVASGDVVMDSIREAIDQLCAAAGYWPDRAEPMTGALEG